MESEKLYLFSEDFYYGRITYFFMATDSQLEKVMGREFYWSDEVGKHTEGEYTLDESNVTLVDIPQEAALTLYHDKVTPTKDIQELLDYLDEIEGED